MGIIEYTKSAILFYDFSRPEIVIFNRKKKLIAWLALCSNFVLLPLTIFHTWNNNNLYRFCKFIVFVSLSEYSSDRLTTKEVEGV